VAEIKQKTPISISLLDFFVMRETGSSEVLLFGFEAKGRR
jgi:hypothetical protein